MVIIPSIGATGTYAFKPPFDLLFDSQTEFTCKSIRYLGDYLSNNEDVYTQVYERYRLGRETYEIDLRENNPVIGLQSAKGVWMYVPARYIVSWPSVNGVRYISAMITSDIGPFPADKDFSGLITDIKEFIHSRLGVMPKTELVAISKPILISFEQHQTVENQRNAIVGTVKTHYSQYQELLQINTSLQQKLTEVEAYLVNILPRYLELDNINQGLENQIVTLNTQISALESTIVDKDAEIARLNQIIEDLVNNTNP